jgi:hypothetical protein
MDPVTFIAAVTLDPVAIAVGTPHEVLHCNADDPTPLISLAAGA